MVSIHYLIDLLFKKVYLLSFLLQNFRSKAKMLSCLYFNMSMNVFFFTKEIFLLARIKDPRKQWRITDSNR
jgi:hypothetical protein